MGKFKFIIVGSGWRSLYYVRIAKALPEVFELCAMYCRSEEKAMKMANEHQIHTTTSIEECLSYQPDFAVVVVTKSDIAKVSMEWMDRGLTVLCETPASLDLEILKKLWALEQEGKKLVVAEQYTHYPIYRAMKKVLDRNLLGSRDVMNISLAHEYHGASLMREFLGLEISDGFAVKAKTYEFPTADTLTRYEKIQNGKISNKKRTVATFEFESGKVALYDFDSEQYRSPIRKNTCKLQGQLGELIDDTLYYLDANTYEEHVGKIQVSTRAVHTEYDNPNLSDIEEVTGITFDGESVYEPEFGLCGLAQDETAIATMMKKTALYAHGEGATPYPLKDALTDAYVAILLQKACETGEVITSEKQIWME